MRQLITLVAMVVMALGHCALSNGAVLATISDGINVQNEMSTVEVLTTYANVSLKDCVRWSSTSKVVSINFLYTDALGICTILTKSVSVNSDPGHICSHKNPCDPNPCQHRGTCTAKGEDFKCKCIYPMGGPTCEDLICNECHRNNDLVMFWDTSERAVTWQQNYEYCERRGLKLMLVKDNSKHELVKRVLSHRFPGAETKVTFWIGLNRTSKSAPFTYIDGTTFDEKFDVPWGPARPTEALCVCIASGNYYKFSWDDDDCTNLHSDWAYHPLCEQTYSFLVTS